MLARLILDATAKLDEQMGLERRCRGRGQSPSCGESPQKDKHLLLPDQQLTVWSHTAWERGPKTNNRRITLSDFLPETSEQGNLRLL